MSNLQTENLEERIERIRKRNEELEKKYREAEEDRLMALKDNAMVKIRPPTDEDWPREHKYDKLDFTYDQQDVEEDKIEGTSKETETNVKTRRDYKKFADGEGPPPDPAYNFLADAERDGSKNKNEQIELKSSSNQEANNNSSNNTNANRRGDWKHSSARGRGNGGNGYNNRGRGGKNRNYNEYDSWKNEREKIDEERISRQKVGEGKWRREWDSEKLNELNNKSNDGNKSINKNSRSPTHNSSNNQKLNTEINHTPQRGGSGNIMVSVSQNENGEVKSVKLTAAPTIGTGRVGPRQISKPQFQVQKETLNPSENHSSNYFNNNNHSSNNIKSYNNKKESNPKLKHSTSFKNDHVAPIIKTSNINDRLKRSFSTNNEEGFNKGGGTVGNYSQQQTNTVFVKN